jgi:DNA-directed RNA polymerase subunit RPC12/RpoP
MDSATKDLVRQRAGYRCEYCRLPESASALRFHIEHIVARQHGGTDDMANLALACPECNYQKGTNLTGMDPDTGALTPLFHPRRDEWATHFGWDGARIVGRTATGRTAVWLLEMNTGDRVRWRELLFRLGLLN